MSFTSGMSHLDYKSMIRGQESLRLKNQIQSEDFQQRFSAAIAAEIQNPQCTSLKAFCKKYSFSTKTLCHPRHKEKRLQVASLPAMRKPGNPSGWSKNGIYNSPDL